MAYEENLKSISYDADASIGIFTGPPGVPGSATPNAGMQYRALRISGKSQVGLASAGRTVTDGVTVVGAAITSATAAWTQADVGRPISGGSIPAGATIATVTDATHATLSAPATAAASTVSFVMAAFGVDGVLQNKPQRPGAAATVGIQGVTMAIAGSALAAGIEVIPDSAGRFVAGTQSAAGLRFRTVTIASGVGELVSLAIS